MRTMSPTTIQEVRRHARPIKSESEAAEHEKVFAILACFCPAALEAAEGNIDDAETEEMLVSIDEARKVIREIDAGERSDTNNVKSYELYAARFTFHGDVAEPPAD